MKRPVLSFIVTVFISAGLTLAASVLGLRAGTAAR